MKIHNNFFHFVSGIFSKTGFATETLIYLLNVKNMQRNGF